MDFEEQRKLVKEIAEECLYELYPANIENVKKVIQRSHKRATELAKNKTSDKWTKKDMEDSVKEFGQQQYADRKFALNCSFREKLNYIHELVGSMMDICPIQVVGKEHPAKENLKKQKDKKDKCQEQ